MTTKSSGETHLYPPNYEAILMRAADTLKLRWPCSHANFKWWADGEYHFYTARFAWTHDMVAPRVEVYRETADFVCRSLEGRPEEIDPEGWQVHVPEDEAARYVWEEEQRLLGSAR